jgi:hypothetical protein
MKLSRNREVEAVVFAGVQSPQELEALPTPLLLCSDGLRATQRQIVDYARPRLAASELRYGRSKFLVDGDLNSRLSGRHDLNVPPRWDTCANARGA